MNVIAFPETGDVWQSVSDEVLEQLGRDTSQARGLPNAAFTDGEFHELEKTRLFSRTWSFAAPASTLADPGDILSVEIAGHPLILVRGHDREVRAFHNVCPHRGARLVTESRCSRTVLTCPYHAWSYGLDGALKGRPHYHGHGRHQTACDMSGEDVRLFAIPCRQWHDWVFVNIDGKAPEFGSFMAPAEEHFAGYDIGQFRRSDQTMAVEFACNWKLAVENYCDFYHVFSVHPALDRMMSPQTRQSMRESGCHLLNGYAFTGSGRGIAIDDSGPGLPSQEGIDADLESSTRYAVLFPNFAVNVYPGSLQAVLFEPLAADRTIMHMWFYYVGDAARAAAHAEARSSLYQEWVELNNEDKDICLRLQQGRACAAYDGGRLAPHWDRGTVHFHRQVAHAIRREGAFAES